MVKLSLVRKWLVASFLIVIVFAVGFYSGSQVLSSSSYTTISSSGIDVPGFVNATEYWWGTHNRTDVLANPEQTASFVIWNDTSTNDVYAKNCSSGQVVYGGSWDAGGVDGANASAVIQSAVDALTDGGTVFIKKGLYLITVRIELKSNVWIVGECWETILKLADNRPNGQASDWVNHCVLWHETGSLENVKIANLQIDGNKANQAIGNITHGNGAIYLAFTSESQNIRIENCYIHNHLRYGIVFHYGNYHNCHVIKCKVKDNNYNDISFFVYDDDAHDCSVQQCVVGGDTGDIGIDAWSSNTGTLHNILFANNIVEPMTGTGGSGGQINIGLQFESGVTNSLMTGNVINAKQGIKVRGDNNLIIGNHVYLQSYVEGYTIVGIYVKASTNNEISNNHIFGKLQSYEYGLFSEYDASYNRWFGNVIENCTYGLQLKGDYEIFKHNRFRHCTTAINFHADASNWTIKYNDGYTTENSGTATVSNGDYFAHGLAGKPDIITLTCMNATYDGVPVVVNCNYANTNSTHVCVSLYWTNGTAITTDLLVSYYVEYEP